MEKQNRKSKKKIFQVTLPTDGERVRGREGREGDQESGGEGGEQLGERKKKKSNFFRGFERRWVVFLGKNLKKQKRKNHPSQNQKSSNLLENIHEDLKKKQEKGARGKEGVGGNLFRVVIGHVGLFFFFFLLFPKCEIQRPKRQVPDKFDSHVV